MTRAPARLRRALAAGVAGVCVVALAACVPGAPDPEPTEVDGVVLGDEQVGPLVDDIQQRSAKDSPTMRLADGLVPPTNQWFSALVFGDQPQPVFPMPLAFELTGNGFAFGLPEVVSGADVITGGRAPVLPIVTDAAQAQVTDYDVSTVTIAQTSDDSTLGHVVIAQGSPVVSYTADEDHDVTLPQGFEPAGDGVWTAELGGTTYAMVSDAALADDGVTLMLEADASASWFPVPEGGDVEALAALAQEPITGSEVSGSVGETATTTLSYQTAGDSDVLLATMPHQREQLGSPAECGLGSYPSLYGEMTLCSGTELEWTVPLIEATGSLDLSELTDEERAELVEQVQADAEQAELPRDTYFGGKALYRQAALLDLARQLDADEVTASVEERLREALLTWTEPDGCTERVEQCFVYDPEARGIVGQEASFGSDEFNDHHFHYGYFLYAAGVLAADDRELAEELAPVMNLVAADIASSGGKYFPERRAFDAYAGHSWASGFSPFADGNNQESSSEAVTAYNGLALWAQAIGDDALEQQATWMLSAEAASALAYWTNFDRSEAVYSNYEHGIVSLNWGGKREYATWFSDEPNAKLAILLIPMSPVAGYLGGDSERIMANVEEAAPDGYDVQFGDYLLMYRALAGEEQASEALEIARELPDDSIDDGDSRSYLLAWLMRLAP